MINVAHKTVRPSTDSGRGNLGGALPGRPNNRCADPVYELVLILDIWLRRKKVRANADLAWPPFQSSHDPKAGRSL